MPERRSTASCWDRLDGSMSISASRSRTGFGPSWSSSRTRMRTGWPSIRKNSALAWYSGTGIGGPLCIVYHLAIYRVENLFKQARDGLMVDVHAVLGGAGLRNVHVREYVR